MPSKPTKTLYLEILGKEDALENRIPFGIDETVGNVLSRIRTQQSLKPNVQLQFNIIDGLHQEKIQGELLGHEPMSKHFPRGGKVRIEPKTTTDDEKDMRISHNIAHAESKLNSIIAIQSKDGSKATIERNQSYKGAKLISLITDNTEILNNIDFN